MMGAVTLTACKPSLRVHGASRIHASYRTGSLNASVPIEFDVLTVAAAGEAALLERGYVIARREGTQGRMTIVADTPAGAERQWIERTVIFKAAQRNRGSHIEISVRPIPNEPETRAVLDGTLLRLGL